MSPTITRAQFDRGEKTPLDVFEDQVRGWFLEPAYAVAKLQQGGPALLLLLVPYFEMIECYLTGRESTGHSSEFARRGVQAVFPEVGEEVARIFIKEVRHGMTHELVFRLVAFTEESQTILRLVLRMAFCGLTRGLLSDAWWIISNGM